MADPHNAPEPGRFSLKQPRLKWILLAVLVVDVIVLGSLGLSDLAGGAKPLPSGPVTQVQPQAGAGPSSPPARVCGNAAILGGGPRSTPAGLCSKMVTGSAGSSTASGSNATRCCGKTLNPASSTTTPSTVTQPP